MTKTTQKKIFEKIIRFMKITKPMVFFDIKTTGPNISVDKIIEMAYIKIMPNSRVIKNSFLLNPEIEISEESIEFHNINKEELANKPSFKDKARDIWDIFNNCYFSGFNIINFDLPLLRREFARVGMDFDYSQNDVIDSRVIFSYMEPNTLSVACQYYCQKEHLGSDNAMRDVEIALEIFAKQFGKYKEIRDKDFVNNIYRFQDDRLRGHERKFYWRDGEAYFNFSRHKDTPLSEVAKFDPDYLAWMLQADFSKEIKNIVSHAIKIEEKNKEQNT